MKSIVSLPSTTMDAHSVARHAAINFIVAHLENPVWLFRLRNSIWKQRKSRKPSDNFRSKTCISWAENLQWQRICPKYSVLPRRNSMSAPVWDIRTEVKFLCPTWTGPTLALRLVMRISTELSQDKKEIESLQMWPPPTK